MVLVFASTLASLITAFSLTAPPKDVIKSFERNGLSELKYEVVLLDIFPNDAIALKDQLLAAGLDQGTDFVWAYSSAEYDNFSGSAVRDRRTVFRFRDPATATFYQLKWG